MLGKPGATRPVNSSYCAAECTTMSPWHDRITARSSTHAAVSGNRSETSIPLWPYFRKVRCVPSSLALRWTNWYFASPNSFGRGCPSSWFRSGLGSNVSRWLGPPAMNRKMTDARLGGDGGAAWGRADWRSQRRPGPAPGSGARPAPGRRSRRRRRGRTRGGCGSGGHAGRIGMSGNIQEPVQVEHGQGEFLRRLIAEERERDERSLRRVGGRPSASRKARSTSRSGSPPDLALEAAGEGRGEVVREPAVEHLERLGRVGARLAPRAAGQQRRGVEGLEERQPQVPLGDQVDRTAVVLARGSRRPATARACRAAGRGPGRPAPSRSARPPSRFSRPETASMASRISSAVEPAAVEPPEQAVLRVARARPRRPAADRLDCR